MQLDEAIKIIENTVNVDSTNLIPFIMVLAAAKTCLKEHGSLYFDEKFIEIWVKNMNFMEILLNKTDDELLELLISCKEEYLPIIKSIWNKRHPEDKI
jgi:hypothetical protein